MINLKASSRDNGRTPMQWDGSANANFTTGTPWLPVNKNYTEVNVAAEEKDPASVLNYFKKMVQIRKNNPVLVYGDYKLIQPEHPSIYAYSRKLDGKEMTVLLNFTEKNATIELQESNLKNEVIINNYNSIKIQNKTVSLDPYQAVILAIK
jgi:oligo-1,6-glucosidase